MDEDELLYREMNEEDPWYMGDASEENDEDESYDDDEAFVQPTSEESQKTSFWSDPSNWIGCGALIIVAIGFFVWLFS